VEGASIVRVAITGGSGFVGRHLAARFDPAAVVALSRRTGVDIADVEALTAAFAGCEAVIHCAGINREIGEQTYNRVHVEGTRAVVEAATRTGVTRLIMLSFLRARPNCGSPYHETKWQAEQIIRGSGMDYTILKAGMIYGRGDHFVDHISRAVHTIPLFATVGYREKPIRPIPVSEMVDVLVAATTGRLPGSTVAVVGGEQLLLSEAVRRVASSVGRQVVIVPAPVWGIRAVAQVTQWVMKTPLIATSQARMLAEGVSEPMPGTASLPEELRPHLGFTPAQISAALPPPGGFGWHDLRFSR